MFHPLALVLILLGCFAFSGLICANFTAINDTAVTFSGVDATTTADFVDDVTDAAVDNATDAAVDENDVEMFATTPTGLIDENEVVPENIVLEDLSLCNTTSGYIRGQTIITGNGKEVFQYLGIPFAEPPVGELRFRKPVAKRRWEVKRIARKADRGPPGMQTSQLTDRRIIPLQCDRQGYNSQGQEEKTY